MSSRCGLFVLVALQVRGEIAGRITSADTNQPLAGARVLAVARQSNGAPRFFQTVSVADGAYSIAFTNGARTSTGLQRAYVSNFRDDSISVIELDPRSPNFHREVARIRENSRILP